MSIERKNKEIIVYSNTEYSRENECMHQICTHTTNKRLSKKIFLITGEIYTGWMMPLDKIQTLPKLNELGFLNTHIFVVRPQKIFVGIKYTNFRIFLHPSWGRDVRLLGASVVMVLIYKELFLQFIGWGYM